MIREKHCSRFCWKRTASNIWTAQLEKQAHVQILEGKVISFQGCKLQHLWSDEWSHAIAITVRIVTFPIDLRVEEQDEDISFTCWP